MEKEIITIDGKDRLVREDTVKAFRFQHWGLEITAIGLAILAILALAIILFMGFR